MRESELKNTKLWEWIATTSLWVGVILALFTVGVPFLVYFIWGEDLIRYLNFINLIKSNEGGATILDLGPLGDFIAGTTVPFFTFASFLLLAGTSILQRVQLNLQKSELQATNETMREQAKTMALQRFDNTFFQLLSFHNQLVNNFKYELISSKYQGREAIEELLKELVTDLSRRLNGANNDRIECYTIVIEECNKFQRKRKNLIGHYLRNLYRFLKYVDEFEFEGMELEESKKIKSEYIDILRAQLSQAELTLIFYNAMSFYGLKTIKYIKKYKLLDNFVLENIYAASMLVLCNLLAENRLDYFLESYDEFEEYYSELDSSDFADYFAAIVLENDIEPEIDPVNAVMVLEQFRQLKKYLE